MNFDHISHPYLEHYGVKGMKWGQQGAAAGKTPGTFTRRASSNAKAKVGGIPMKYDAARTAALRAKNGKTPGVFKPVTKRGKAKKQAKQLSDQELKDALSRMDMERRYKQLTGGDKTAAKVAATFISGVAVASLKGATTQIVTKQIKDMMEKKMGI